MIGPQSSTSALPFRQKSLSSAISTTSLNRALSWRQLSGGVASAPRRFPLPPSHRVDAASGWRSHASAPRLSGPFFRVGKGPPGPDPTTNRRARQGHPRCRSNRSAQAAHPMGSLPMGEASACAKARGLLLPPSAQPATGPSRLVAPVSELSVRVEWRKPLAAAPRRLCDFTFELPGSIIRVQGCRVMPSRCPHRQQGIRPVRPSHEEKAHSSCPGRAAAASGPGSTVE